jgi:pimeloyl-ACP methyl ester carboxylesterase
MIVFGQLRAVAMAFIFAVAVVPGASTEDLNTRATNSQSSGYLDVSGSKIYYEERGSGPAIVLLHDGLLPAVTWDDVWESLAARHHVIRYDRRGYGRSDAATSPFSPREDLLKLLTYLQVPHAIVVGSSSGGALAIDFVIEHPQLVDGLFLIGPVLHGMQPTAYFRERGSRNNEPMERDDIQAAARNWSQDRFLLAGASEKARNRVFELLLANLGKLKTYNEDLEKGLSPPASKRLSEIKVPTLIVAGEADIADVHAYCGAINAGIRESERSVVKDAGHLAQLEKPEEVIHQLEALAARCGRR